MATNGGDTLNDSSKPRRAAPQLSDFPHRIADNIRHTDLDSQGHVNNAVVANYFENGRVALFRLEDASLGVEGVGVVLAHTEINYVRELNWPGTIEIGTAVAQIGRSSFTFAHGVFNNGACAAYGSATIVLTDAATRRSTPLPETLIARLQPWLRKT